MTDNVTYPMSERLRAYDAYEYHTDGVECALCFVDADFRDEVAAELDRLRGIVVNRSKMSPPPLPVTCMDADAPMGEKWSDFPKRAQDWIANQNMWLRWLVGDHWASVDDGLRAAVEAARAAREATP